MGQTTVDDREVQIARLERSFHSFLQKISSGMRRLMDKMMTCRISTYSPHSGVLPLSATCLAAPCICLIDLQSLPQDLAIPHAKWPRRSPHLGAWNAGPPPHLYGKGSFSKSLSSKISCAVKIISSRIRICQWMSRISDIELLSSVGPNAMPIFRAFMLFLAAFSWIRWRCCELKFRSGH